MLPDISAHVLAATAWVAMAAATTIAGVNPPNILVILTDDQVRTGVEPATSRSEFELCSIALSPCTCPTRPSPPRPFPSADGGWRQPHRALYTDMILGAGGDCTAKRMFLKIFTGLGRS